MASISLAAFIKRAWIRMHDEPPPGLTAAPGYLNTQEPPLLYPHPFLRYLGCDRSLSAVSVAADHANFVIASIILRRRGHMSHGAPDASGHAERGVQHEGRRRESAPWQRSR